jgi:UDP-N-acetylmuramoyl-tripeptide--D-alanyl-D-alanine ligase
VIYLKLNLFSKNYFKVKHAMMMMMCVATPPIPFADIVMTTVPNDEIVATFSFETLLVATQGTVVSTKNAPILSQNALFAPVTDTRGLTGFNFVPQAIQPLFIPLVGETFDGHQFLNTVHHLGVSVCLASTAFLDSSAGKAWLATNPTVTVIAVADTLNAFQALATAHRQRIQTNIVALTGSSGKTTVKELLAFGLAASFKVQATQKNFNNDIGVAKTLLSIHPATQVAVVEMGMRGLGEIARLAHTALPDIGLLLNVGPAHIGRLGSLTTIAQAKCELAEGVQQQLIFNADDTLITTRLAELSLSTTVQQQGFSLQQAQNLTPLKNGCYRFSVENTLFETTLPGEHQVRNWLAVIAVATVLGVPLQVLAQQLQQFQSVAGRFETIVLGQQATAINDAYNANPSSMHASLEAFLNANPANTAQLLVLGTMQELGEFGQQYHETLFRWLATNVATTALKGIVLIGADAPNYQAFIQNVFTEHEQALFPVLIAPQVQTAATQLPAWVAEQLPVAQRYEWLLKGSRTHQLEAILPILQKIYEPK